MIYSGSLLEVTRPNAILLHASVTIILFCYAHTVDSLTHFLSCTFLFTAVCFGTLGLLFQWHLMAVWFLQSCAADVYVTSNNFSGALSKFAAELVNIVLQFLAFALEFFATFIYFGSFGSQSLFILL